MDREELMKMILDAGYSMLVGNPIEINPYQAFEHALSKFKLEWHYNTHSGFTAFVNPQIISALFGLADTR